MNPMNSSNGLHKLARPTWNRSARTTRRGGRTVREALPIHLVIVGQWATAPHCNGFPGRRRSEPASASQRWSRCGGDHRIGRGRQRWREVERRRVDTQRHRVGAVPAERRPAAPLVLADRRSDLQLPEVDAAVLAATTEAVDLDGADDDNDGAHPLEKPCAPGLHHLRRELATPPSARVAVTATLRLWDVRTVPQPEPQSGRQRLCPHGGMSGSVSYTHLRAHE